MAINDKRDRPTSELFGCQAQVLRGNMAYERVEDKSVITKIDDARVGYRGSARFMKDSEYACCDFIRC